MLFSETHMAAAHDVMGFACSMHTQVTRPHLPHNTLITHWHFCVGLSAEVHFVAPSCAPEMCIPLKVHAA